MLVNIIVWIIIGGVAGWLAGIVMKSRSGLIGNIVIGIIGAFIGGFVLNLLNVDADVSGLNIPSLITAFIGAVILLGVMRMVRG